jgi:tRNA (mo5U34)-methyltransferase
MDARSVQARVDRLSWYHTIDVVPGVTTRGWFDLRHALPLMPWPDVRGKRCLDIGTWDGFYAYELERRGASEVVALDIEDLATLDYPPEVRAAADLDLSQTNDQPRRAGFLLLNEILGSSVQWRGGNIYDLDAASIGTFDVVVLGSLLLHLRDPVRALDAVRRVTSGSLLCVDHIEPVVNLLGWRRPLFELRGEGRDFQWWLASDSGLQQLLRVAGFTIDACSKRFLLHFGPGGAVPPTLRSWRYAASRLVTWLQTGDGAKGHMHRAYLAHPRF